MKYNVKLSEKLQKILGGNPPLSVVVSEDGYSFEAEGFMSSSNDTIKIPAGRELKQEVARLIASYAVSSALDIDECSIQEEIALIPAV